MAPQPAANGAHGTAGRHSHLVPLDGLRAIASSSVVFSHIIYVLSIPPNHLAMRALMQSYPWLMVIVNLGFASLDTFLILTGLLACYHLVPAMERGPRPPLQVALNYIKRRALRIVPAYYATILLTWLVIRAGKAAGDEYVDHMLAFRPTTFEPDTGIRDILLCLFFLSNVNLGGFLPVSWSLAVQMQFAAVLPLLLLALRPRSPGFRGRVAALAVALLAVSVAWRVHQVHVTGARPPLTLFQQPGDPGYLMVKAVVDNFYTSSVARLSHLSMGLMVGLLVLSPAAVATLRRYGQLATCAAIVSAAYIIAISLVVHDVEYQQPATAPLAGYHAYVLTWGLLVPAAISALLAWLLSCAGPVASTTAWLLGHPFWKVPAKLSYYVFLLHTLAILAVWRGVAALLPPPAQLLFTVAGGGAAGGGSLFAALHMFSVLLMLWLLVQGLSTLAAVLLDAAVERFSSLGRSLH